eukprot:TRINITY_DN639_c0_g1_i1.p2 TRINITY_DN639_c0_g1~~TRINITY_DN639_c0_g1_i1.p2  ORF type:complete len:448 (-),score=100.13 TRINITY_DN639_c0_g1_i1:132-1475(-)
METERVSSPKLVTQRPKLPHLVVLGVFIGTVLLSFLNDLKSSGAPSASDLDNYALIGVANCSSSPSRNHSATIDFNSDEGFEKLKFLDDIPNLHPLIKQQWRKFKKSLDDNGRMTKECLDKSRRFRNGEIPDVHGMYYNDHMTVFGATRNQDLFRNVRDATISNGRVNWNHDPWFREKTLERFLNDLYRDNPDLPDIDFWHDLEDGAMCTPWITEDCALPLVVLEAGMDCAALVGTSRPTIENNIGQFAEPDWSKWGDKKEVAIWRGSTTGGLNWNIDYHNGWRFKLVNMSFEHPDLLDARFTGYCQAKDDSHALEKYLEDTGRLCRGCRIDSGQWPEWKYLVVVDGNSNPDRFPFFLATGSVVLRQEWVGLEVFEHGLVPWVHYIPVLRDLSDLMEKIEWAKEHDEECKQIAKNAWAYINRSFTHTANVEYWKGFIRAYAQIVPRF